MSIHTDLLNFIPWLRAHAPVSIQEVSRHFDWDEEQVVQYVLLAGVSGFGEMHGELFDVTLEGEHIYVLDSLGLDRPFRLDQLEAACAVMGLDFIQAYPALYPDLDMSAVASAKQKVLAASNEVPQVQILNSTSVDQNISIIDEAIELHKQIEFLYWNEASGISRQRRVSPRRLVLSGGVVRLEAWCHIQNDWRTFILNRMTELVCLDQVSSFPDSDFVPMKMQKIVVELPLKLKYLLENFTVESLGRSKNGKLTATILVREPAWLARQIMSSGCQISVLEPAKFRKKVIEIIDLARKAYE